MCPSHCTFRCLLDAVREISAPTQCSAEQRAGELGTVVGLSSEKLQVLERMWGNSLEPCVMQSHAALGGGAEDGGMGAGGDGGELTAAELTRRRDIFLDTVNASARIEHEQLHAVIAHDGNLLGLYSALGNACSMANTHPGASVVTAMPDAGRLGVAAAEQAGSGTDRSRRAQLSKWLQAEITTADTARIYTMALAKEGYEDKESLAELSQAALVQLGIRPGHATKVLRVIAEEQAADEERLVRAAQ